MPTIAIGSSRLARSSVSSIVTLRRYSRSCPSSATTRPRSRVDEIEQFLVRCLHQPVGTVSPLLAVLVELGGQGPQGGRQPRPRIAVGESGERLLELPHLRRQWRDLALRALHPLQQV